MFVVTASCCVCFLYSFFTVSIIKFHTLNNIIVHILLPPEKLYISTFIPVYFIIPITHNFLILSIHLNFVTYSLFTSFFQSAKLLLSFLVVRSFYRIYVNRYPNYHVVDYSSSIIISSHLHSIQFFHIHLPSSN